MVCVTRKLPTLFHHYLYIHTNIFARYTHILFNTTYIFHVKWCDKCFFNPILNAWYEELAARWASTKIHYTLHAHKWYVSAIPSHRWLETHTKIVVDCLHKRDKVRKIAIITPLYKAEDPMFFNNYRPIALLSVFSKIIERLIYTRKLDFINKE